MRIIATLFMLIVLLLLSTPAFCLDYYVNGTTGTDSATCGQLPATPCKSIKKVLANIPNGEVTIKIAGGTYVESELLIPVAAAGTKNDITFSGGWNASFTGTVCNADNTVIVPGNRTAPPYIYLFSLSVFGDQRQAALTLKCLTLKKNVTGDIPRAIQTHASQQGLAELHLEHIKLTGFTDQEAIFLDSRDDGTLTVRLDESLISGNTSHMILFGQSFHGGLFDLRIKNSRLLANGSPGANSNPILYLSCSQQGNLAAAIENTVIAHNYSSVDPPAIRSAVRNAGSVLVLDLLNTTITSNSSSGGGDSGAVGLYAYDSSQLTANVTNTIIRGNGSTNGPNDIVMRTDSILTFSADFSMIGEYQIHGPVTYSSTHEVDEDPALDSRYHLSPGSPARDAGLCGYLTGGGPLYQYHRVAPYDDIDGDKRPGWGKLMGCDIGADEYHFPWILFNPAARGKRTP